MSKKRPGDDADKWELIRRLRYGALLKLFRRRWGHVLPDDDAGRDDLWLLVTNVSLPLPNPKKRCTTSSRCGLPGCRRKSVQPTSNTF